MYRISTLYKMTKKFDLTKLKALSDNKYILLEV